jgi:hypothetical protein
VCKIAAVVSVWEKLKGGRRRRKKEKLGEEGDIVEGDVR